MAATIHDSDDSDRLGHLLWEVHSHVSRLAEAALADSPLTPALSGVLDLVAANPGLSIATMAREVPTSAQGISQLVAKLEELEFLERRLGERGHGVALFLTKAGERACRQADERKSAVEVELTEALGQRNHDQLVRSLQRARPVVIELGTDRRR